MTVVTVHLDDETAKKLDWLANKLGFSCSSLAAQAVAEYLMREEWQISEIEAGLSEAERDAFGTAGDLARVVAKYGVPK